MEDTERTNGRAKRAIFGAITIILACAIGLVIVEWALRVVGGSAQSSERMDEGLILYDRQLGWRLNPGWFGKHTHYDFDATYKINSEGLRGDVAKLSAPGDRVYFLGDSFTFGLGANEGETFTSQLNAQSAPNAPTYINLGVPGYAPDQQKLLLDGFGNFIAGSSTVVWVVYLGNDLLDIRYPYPLQAPYGKPFYQLDEEELVLRNSPVQRGGKSGRFSAMSVQSAILGDYDLYPAWQDLLNDSSIGSRINSVLGFDEAGLEEHVRSTTAEDIRLFSAIVDSVAQTLTQSQSELVFVMMPGSGYFRNGTVPGIYQTTLEAELSEALKNKGFKVFELGETLSTRKQDVTDLYFPNDGHLTPLGHKVVAELLAGAGLWAAGE